MINTCLFGDCRDGLRQIISAGVRPQAVVTSPPYFGLRDYGHPGQLGLERTPDEYVARMVEVFALVREALADDGTLWLNIGDSYAGSWGAQSRGNTASEATSNLEGSSMLEARQIGAYPLGRTGTGSLKNTPGLKPKDLIGIPWMLAFALRADGWYLRQDIIWHKPNPMPESVRDRCTKAHEYMFLLSKSERYYFDQDAILEPASPNTHARLSQDVQNQIGSTRVPRKTNGNMKAVGRGYNERPRKAVPNGAGMVKNNQSFDAAMAIMPTHRNKRSVWAVATMPYSGAHFATFPPALVEPCILAGSRPGDVVLDPFMGSGTTARVAMALGRQWVGCEINPEYKALQDGRTERVQMRIDGAPDITHDKGNL